MGEAGTRHSLRPLDSREDGLLAELGRSRAPRTQTCICCLTSLNQNDATTSWLRSSRGKAIALRPRDMSALVRAGKQVVDPSPQPIGDEADPFAHRRVGSGEAFTGQTGEGQKVLASADPPVDGIGLDGKTD